MSRTASSSPASSRPAVHPIGRPIDPGPASGSPSRRPSKLAERIDAWKTLTAGQCWEWPARTDPDGRALVKVGGRTIPGALAVWRAVVGELPAAHRLFRRCINFGCVNPAHYVACRAIGVHHYACPECGASLASAHLAGHLAVHRLMERLVTDDWPPEPVRLVHSLIRR